MRADEEQRLDESGEPSPEERGDAPAPESGTEIDEISSERVLAVTGDRLTDVLLAADQAAEEILEAARAEAREFVGETQQATIDRAENLRRETDNLLAQTTDLTSKVAELARATELVMENFRAELSLDAPEVREESIEMAAAPEASVGALSAGPAESPVPSEDAPVGVGPSEDSSADAGEPDPAEPVAETVSFEAAAPPASTPQAGEDADDGPALDADPVVEMVETIDDAAAPAAAPEVGVNHSEPDPSPKRRGLFGRLRRRQASSEPTPTDPAPTETAPVSTGPAAPVSEGARLIARQMLATGLPEHEVRRQLREQFRLADPQAVLDSLGRDQSKQR